MCVFTLQNVSTVCPVIIAKSDSKAGREAGTSLKGEFERAGYGGKMERVGLCLNRIPMMAAGGRERFEGFHSAPLFHLEW